MSTYSDEHLEYLKKKKHETIIVHVIRISIIVLFLVIWEALARVGAINTFLSSSPSQVFTTVFSLSTFPFLSISFIVDFK